MLNILVTGADGFIGSHLCELLVKKGHKVKGLALYNSMGKNGWLDDIPSQTANEMEIVLGDIRDSGFCMQCVSDVDIVMHLAALIAIPYSYIAPESYVQTNISGTLNLLQAAKAHGIQQFIHTSTSEVYGTAQTVPIDESHRLHAQSPYAATKIAADQLAMSFSASFNLPVTIIRPFNTFGPRQSTRAVIPTIITQLAKGAEAIHLGSLDTTRDFNYVEDTVAGMASAIGVASSLGEVINLGSRREVSIGQTVELIQALMGTNVPVISEESRMRPEKSEVMRLVAANEKADRILQWKPHYSELDGFKEALQKTIDWFKNPNKLAHYASLNYML